MRPTGAARRSHRPHADQRRQRHRRLLRGRSRQRCRLQRRRLAAHRGSGPVCTHGELYITGRAKEIIFVNGQNYYPHDLEAIAQRAAGLELGKVVVAGVRPRGAQTEQLVVFVLHRGDMEEFLPLATQVARLINEQTGLEVAAVVPVKRIPKTTSGKIQRHLLEEALRRRANSPPSCASWRALRAAQRGPAVGLAQRRSRRSSRRSATRPCRVSASIPRQPVRNRRQLPEAHRDPRADRPRIPGPGGPDRAVRLPDHRRARRAPAKQARLNSPPRMSARAADSDMARRTTPCRSRRVRRWPGR